MESPYAAISLTDVAKNGAQNIIGVSPVSGWMTPQAGRARRPTKINPIHPSAFPYGHVLTQIQTVRAPLPGTRARLREIPIP